MKRYIIHLMTFTVALFIAELAWGQGTNRDSLPKPTKANDTGLQSGYYTMNDDITLTGNYRYRIQDNENVTIYLNGKTFDVNNKVVALFSISEGTVTICGPGTIKNSRKSCFYIEPETGKNAKLILKDGVIIEGCQPSDGNGGAIEVVDRGVVEMYDATIQNCRAVQGAGVHIGTNGVFKMYEGASIKDNKVFAVNDANNWEIPSGDNLPIGISTPLNPKTKYSYEGNDIPNKNGNYEYKGGGVYVNKGTFEMHGGTIENNVSINGGGVYVTNTATFKLSGGTIKNNYATSSGFDYGNGGGVYLSSGATFSIDGTSNDIVFEGNRCTRYGGGIYVNGSTVNITECDLKNNYASSGGGLASEGNNCTMTVKDCTIELNYAKGEDKDTRKSGGGIFMQNGNFSVEGVTALYDNESTNGNGGGIYLGAGTFTVKETATFTVGSSGKGNTAKKGDGGGIYCEGNFAMNGKATMEHNSAKNGGAIALKNGTFTISDGSEIKNNEATENGGGLFVNSETTKNISCQGGSFIQNKANLGGGIYASGPITLSVAANVRNNIAKNGGGIYMDNKVNMTFGNGLIITNVAEMESQTSTTTGYGGGIYVNNGTLSFEATTNPSIILGIYNNVAEYEAADIYAASSNTTINLPNVKKMNLTGFDVPGSELYWVEDEHRQRYEDALLNLNVDIEELIVGFGENESAKSITNGTSLDLGYDLVFVTLNATGLIDDNAEISISYPRDDVATVYRKILFVGNNSGTDIKRVGLPSGNWQFKPTKFNYKYEEPTFNPGHATSDNSGTGQMNGYINIKRNVNDNIDIVFTKSNKTKNVLDFNTEITNKMIPGQGGTSSNPKK